MNQALRQVSSQIVIQAAYGRSYSTKEQALKAWKNGADFKIMGGPYCSIRDAEGLVADSSSVFIEFDYGQQLVRVL